MAKKLTESQIAGLKKILEKISSSLCDFGYAICKDEVAKKPPEFHKELCELITKEDRVVLAAPRGFAKSTWVSKVYPLYCALFKKRRDICIISASESLAIEHLRYIKTKIESDTTILFLFGSLQSTKWSENHIQIRHKDGTIINIRAKGAEGQIRGFRPDCIILDDIETDESVVSEEQRKKLKKWLLTACINCLLPGGQLVFIGTVIHPLSILNDFLEVPNGWCKRRWKAYIDGIEEPGHELWPELRTHEWLQTRKKEIGSFAFASEYMNDPRADDDAPIKPSYIREWDELPSQLSAVIAVDPAYSEEAKSDYKVAVLVGIDDKHNRYLIDYIRTHATTGDFIDQALNLYTRNKGYITSVGVPNSGVEKEFFKNFCDKSLERNIGAPIVELKNVFTRTDSNVSYRNKKQRITAALQPLFESGRYYIGHNHNEAKEELLQIGSSRWDDIVDAMTYAEQILTTSFYFDESKEDRQEEEEDFKRSGGYGIQY